MVRSILTLTFELVVTGQVLGLEDSRRQCKQHRESFAASDAQAAVGSASMLQFTQRNSSCAEYTNGNCSEEVPCFSSRGNTTCVMGKCKCANHPHDCAVLGLGLFGDQTVCRPLDWAPSISDSLTVIADANIQMATSLTGFLLPPTPAVTFSPTDAAPTESPTESPTQSPTPLPTTAPTQSPTESPTESPTLLPTAAPTASPTDSPTESSTISPTMSLTEILTYHWDANSGMLGWISTGGDTDNYYCNLNTYGLGPCPFGSRDLSHPNDLRATSPTWCGIDSVAFALQGGVSTTSDPNSASYLGLALVDATTNAVVQHYDRDTNAHIFVGSSWTGLASGCYYMQLRDGKSGASWAHIELQDVVVTPKTM